MEQAVVLADFVGETEEELDLQEGMIVDVLEFGEDGWAEIMINDARGICPNGFLKICTTTEITTEEKPNANCQEEVQKPNANRPLPSPNANRPLPSPNANRQLPVPGERGRGNQARGGSVRGAPRGVTGRGGRGVPRGRGKSVPNRALSNNRGTWRSHSYRGPSPNAIRKPKVDISKDDTSISKHQTEEEQTITEKKENPESPQPEVSEEEIQKKKESKEKHRRNVVTEILTTEQDYVNDVEIVARIYIQPLLTNGLMSKEDHAALFSNLEVLVSVNQQLLSKLTEEANNDDLMIGLIFLEMADFFKLYTAYCANQPKSISTLDRLDNEAAFSQFIYDQTLVEECRGLTLFSFLIKPIQRICKYPLLLRDLLKSTEESHPDHENLVRSLHKIEEVVAYVNDRKRLAENLQKILDVQKQIESTEELNLVEPSRRFVREGNIKVIENGRARERNTYVFNDLIVLTKPRKNMMGNVVKDHFKAQFRLNDVKIYDVADNSEASVKNEVAVNPKDPSQKFKFRFVFNTPEEKAEWMKEIKTLVREFQLRAVKAAKEANEKRAEDEANGIFTPIEEETNDSAKESKSKLSMLKRKTGTTRQSSPKAGRMNKTKSTKMTKSLPKSPTASPTRASITFNKPSPPVKGRQLTGRAATPPKGKESVLKSLTRLTRSESKS